MSNKIKNEILKMTSNLKHVKEKSERLTKIEIYDEGMMLFEEELRQKEYRPILYRFTNCPGGMRAKLAITDQSNIRDLIKSN